MNEENLKNEILKQALKNAIDHKGSSSPKPVFSKVMSYSPDVRKNPGLVMELIEDIVTEVNELKLDEQKKKLKILDATLLVVQKKDSSPKLELNNVSGDVVMRFAPNPNSPIHIGNARQAILNDYLVKKYGGKFILRYDDTDPKTPKKRPVKEAYKWIKNDLEWLGINIDTVHYASKSLDRYYSVFLKLVKKGLAYVCTCDRESFVERRRAGIECPCRNNSGKENLLKFQKMQDGRLKEGSAVCRLKTDMRTKDPAQRDWGMLRIIDKPNHPITGNKYRVWPLLDFQSGVDDHDLGVTHILRGQDLKISELRQKWMYKYLGWKYPLTTLTGHFGVEGLGTFSKSKMREGIKAGEFSGWNDINLPMILSYKRRGFNPEAIRKFILDIGITGGKINISEKKLWSVNKDLIDKISKRYHFVSNPVELSIDFDKTIIVPNHPTNKDLGTRKVVVLGKVSVCGKDLKFFEKGNVVRLLHLGNVVLKGKKLVLVDDQEVDKKSPKIQWVSLGVDARILKVGDQSIEGLAEKGILKEKIGAVFQLVRNSFVKLESKKPLVFIFSHE